MTAAIAGHPCTWIRTGDEVFPAMLSAIESARVSIDFETYIFRAGALGDRFLAAFTAAARRKVRVRVLVDALGSIGGSASLWVPLLDAGGEVRQFNPLALRRMGIRDHRKLLVCDRRVAFIGGFNVSDEYLGDGINRGWCDVGVRLEGPLVEELCASFEEMFARADFRHKRFIRLRRSTARRSLGSPGQQLLLSGPGRGPNPIRKALLRDFASCKDIRVVMAYFLPTWRIRHELVRAVRRGAQVRLVLAGKTDVLISQLAAQSLYRRLLRDGIEIYEYQPQVLHAKLVLCDNAVYAGSANLDPRSLGINYELMVRLESEGAAADGSEVFNHMLAHCRQVTSEEWTRGRTLWRRLKQRWAYLLLVRLDPYIARRQWRALPD